jgi:hypothetical protein
MTDNKTETEEPSKQKPPSKRQQRQAAKAAQTRATPATLADAVFLAREFVH